MKTPILLFLSIASFLLVLGWFAEPPVSQAQQPVPTLRPTATNVGGGSSGSSSRDDTPAPGQVGQISGVVYNFSAGGAPEPGLTVVLDGGGWQAEAVTDSNGYYQFAGLGASKAVLNLRLPPTAHALMPDWPVFTANTRGETTNLGFYWGDTPPLPVLMSVSPATIQAPVNQTFRFQVSALNQSGADASDVLIDVRLPSGIVAVEATTTHGLIDFSEHRIWGQLGTLPNGQTGVLTINARFALDSVPQNEQARITLTYDEQLTAQVVEPGFIAVAAQSQAVEPATAARSTTETSDTPAASPDTPPDEMTAMDDGAMDDGAMDDGSRAETEAETHSDSAQMGAMGASDSNTGEATEMMSGAETESDALPSETASATDTLIPDTGTATSAATSRWPVLSLSLLLIAWAGFTGTKSFLRGRLSVGRE